MATLILRYFLRYFSSTSTEQISPDSAGPFIVSILLALLFSLIQRSGVGVGFALHKIGKFGIDAPQPLVAHASSSHHIIVCEGDRVEVHSLIDRLVPENAFHGRVLESIGAAPSFALKCLQGGGHVPLARIKCLGESNGVLQSNPCARSNRRMNGLKRVADKDDSIEMPLLAGHEFGIEPEGPV